jgi:hypothetical protein
VEFMAAMRARDDERARLFPKRSGGNQCDGAIDH